MKTFKLPISVLAILISAFALSACGKTKRSGGDLAQAPVTVPPAPCSNCNPTDPTDPVDPEPTDPQPTNPPLSYEFTLKGGQTAATGSITTDNVLKVKFKIHAEQGNHVHKATELKVTIAVNGTEVTPQYTSENYTYGKVGETSQVIDVSSYITPGQSTTIYIKNPKSDFYCTYVPNPFWYWDPNTGAYQQVNPQYNAYPGCRKEVHSTHDWGGVLYVQTSSTKPI